MQTPSPSASSSICITPPPGRSYPSFDLAESALHQWTKSHGFNVSKRAAAYLPGKIIHTQYYECDRAGRPKNTGNLVDSERTRIMRGSKRSGCPMRIKLAAVTKKDPTSQWAIVHHKKGSELHNHPPSQDPRIHSAHRRRAAQEIAQAPIDSIQAFVRAQSAAGICAANIHASILIANPDAMVIPKDLTNARNASRQEDLASRTPMEGLFEELEADNFFYRHEINPTTNQLRRLYWAHPATTSLFAEHPDVLILDCTYKTNRYNLPLLNIIAMTGMNTALPVAQCWLPGEVEDDFVWALTTLKAYLCSHAIAWPKVFVSDRDLTCLNGIGREFLTIPVLLCHWHMHRNVLSKTRQVLGQVPVDQPALGQDKFENTLETDSFMATYYDAVNAETETEFEALRATLASKSALLADYLDRHWWKFKKSIVRCWTNDYPHYGHQATSAVEGIHSKCKRWLQNSRGDLYTAFQKLRPWWVSSAKAHTMLIERNTTIAPYRLQASRYTGVIRIITVWALNATDALWRDAEIIVLKRLQRSVCSGSFRIVHGRPCVHELMASIESNGRMKLTPSDFSDHWFARRLSARLPVARVEEPATTRNNTRRSSRSHHRNHGVNGTARDPILSERVDLNHPASPPRLSPTLPFSSALQAGDGLLPAIGSLMPLTDFDITPATISTHGMLTFEQPFIPSRSWGFAGLRPYE